MAWFRKRESNGCVFTDLTVVAMLDDVVESNGCIFTDLTVVAILDVV